MLKKIFTTYLTAAVFGTFLILILAAFFKATMTLRILKHGEELLAKKEYVAIAEALDNTSDYETLFPSLAIRRKCLAVKCHVQTEGFASAARSAKQAYDLGTDEESFASMGGRVIFKIKSPTQDALSRTVNIINTLEIPIDYLVNMIFKKQNREAGIDAWTAYRTMAEELINADNKLELAHLKDTISDLNNAEPLIKNIEAFLSGQKREPPKVATVPPSFPSPPVPTTPAPSVQPQHFGWAVVEDDDTSIYDENGKFMQKITKGTVLDLLSTKNSAAGKVAVCNIITPGTPFNNIVVKTENIQMMKGSIDDADPILYELLTRRARLFYDLAEAEREAQKRAASANPHFTEYEKVRLEYLDFVKKGEAVKKQFETASGPSRHKLGDEMRKMKAQEVQYSQKYKTIKDKYESWKGTAPSGADPETQRIRISLQEIESKLHNYNR